MAQVLGYSETSGRRIFIKRRTTYHSISTPLILTPPPGEPQNGVRKKSLQNSSTYLVYSVLQALLSLTGLQPSVKVCIFAVLSALLLTNSQYFHRFCSLVAAISVMEYLSIFNFYLNHEASVFFAGISEISLDHLLHQIHYFQRPQQIH